MWLSAGPPVGLNQWRDWCPTKDGQGLPTVAATATVRKPSAARMKLAHPTPVRLTPELLQLLDAWRGDRMSRSTAIRLLLEQALKR